MFIGYLLRKIFFYISTSYNNIYAVWMLYIYKLYLVTWLSKHLTLHVSKYVSIFKIINFP